jgi:trigger factor
MEMRRAGFSEAEIRARQNELRQNSAASTARALKEHFILERIAEEEKIEAQEGDFEQEIFLMAMQSGESPRRVRAQIEKRGLMDVLQNQIVERKVLERVQSEAKFGHAVPAVEGRRRSNRDGTGGNEDAIPEAQEEAEAEASDGLATTTVGCQSSRSAGDLACMNCCLNRGPR